MRYATQLMIVVGSTLAGLAVPAIWAGPQVSLEANKAEYIAGEPILLRVDVANGQEPFTFQTGSIGWRQRKFRIEVAREAQGFAFGYSQFPTNSSFQSTWSPAGVDLDPVVWSDRYQLPKSLVPAQRLRRVEMLVITPGTHQLRAVILDKNGVRYESNPVTVTVASIAGRGGVAELGGDEFAYWLGHAIWDIHHMKNRAVTMDPESGNADRFLQIADRVLNDHPQSVFAPYVAYAYAQYHLSAYRDAPPPPAARIERALGLAKGFTLQHTNSWLMADLCTSLFEFHRDTARVGSQLTASRREREHNISAPFPVGTIADAVAFGQSASEADPHNALLSNILLTQQVQELIRLLGDTVPPVLSIIGQNPVVAECGGPYADAGATATDNKDGDITSRIQVENKVDTPKVGTYQVIYRVTDAAGNAATATRTVKVVYKFDGFLPPIGGADATGGNYAQPVKTFKLGSTIPVKFKISCGGAAVKDGAHTLQVIKYNNATTAAEPIDATPTDAATTGNQFRLTGDEWHFNLDTKATGMSVGTWQLKATLSDGSSHTVWIALK